MEIKSRKVEQITVVEVIGEVNSSTASQVQAQVMPLVEPNSKMLLDLTEVPYMSSAGLRVLLILYRTISAKKGQVHLVGLAPEIRDTMQMTGFLDFFTYHEDLQTGLVALS